MIFSIIDDDEKESSSSQFFAIFLYVMSSCKHAISDIINEKTITNWPLSNRWLSICNCPKCNRRLVNSRTKEIYEIRYQSSQGEISVAIFQLEIQEETDDDYEQYGEASTPILDNILLKLLNE